MDARRDAARSDALDPIVSLGFVLVLKLSEVGEIRAALSERPGVRIVYAKVGPRDSLWIEEASR